MIERSLTLVNAAAVQRQAIESNAATSTIPNIRFSLKTPLSSVISNAAATATDEQAQQAQDEQQQQQKQVQQEQATNDDDETIVADDEDVEVLDDEEAAEDVGEVGEDDGGDNDANDADYEPNDDDDDDDDVDYDDALNDDDDQAVINQQQVILRPRLAKSPTYTTMMMTTTKAASKQRQEKPSTTTIAETKVAVLGNSEKMAARQSRFGSSLLLILLLFRRCSSPPCFDSTEILQPTTQIGCVRRARGKRHSTRDISFETLFLFVIINTIIFFWVAYSAIPHSYRVAVAAEDESNLVGNATSTATAAQLTTTTDGVGAPINVDAALASAEMFAKKSFQKVEQVRTNSIRFDSIDLNVPKWRFRLR